MVMNDIDNIRIIPATEYHHHEWFRSNYDNRGVEVHSRIYTLCDKLYDLMMDATAQ